MVMIIIMTTTSRRRSSSHSNPNNKYITTTTDSSTCSTRCQHWSGVFACVDGFVWCSIDTVIWYNLRGKSSIPCEPLAFVSLCVVVDRAIDEEVNEYLVGGDTRTCEFVLCLCVILCAKRATTVACRCILDLNVLLCVFNDKSIAAESVSIENFSNMLSIPLISSV